MALSSLKDVIGEVVVSGLEDRLNERLFLLGWLDRPEEEIRSGAIKQMEGLMGFFVAAIKTKQPPGAKPFYDPAGLAFAVQTAASDFHSLWSARLGYSSRVGISREHWARIKALTRRVALRMNNNEYGHLMPVAELIGRLAEAISRFLDAPAKWDPPARDSEVKATAIARIRTEVYTALHSFALDRIIESHLAEWSRAFSYRGYGSSYDRAQGVAEYL